MFTDFVRQIKSPQSAYRWPRPRWIKVLYTYLAGYSPDAHASNQLEKWAYDVHGYYESSNRTID